MLTGGDGAFVVLVALMATPRLGAAITIAMFIAGQLAMSLVIDHFGLFGVPERPLTLARFAGVLCLAAGVAEFAGCRFHPASDARYPQRRV